MKAPEPEVLHYGIDRLAVSGRRLFGWGWAAHSAQPIRSIALRAEGDSWQQVLPVDAGLVREDVQRAFPQLVGSLSSGFVLTGYVPARPIRRLVLEIHLEPDLRLERDISAVAHLEYEHRRRRRQRMWLLEALWRRLRQGDIAGIFSRARQMNHATPRLPARRLQRVLQRAQGACLVIDHNMGGGSNHYRERLIAERLAAGQTTMLCTYTLSTLDYRLHLYRPGHPEESYRIASVAALDPFLEGVAELFVNSPVSFDEPLVLAEWLARQRAEHPGLRLILTVHDFFMVCPSFILLDADGRYCGIPALETCDSCLSRHGSRYVALSPPTRMGPWRALWGRSLQAADEVRCFSQDSLQLLRRAYPTLDPERLRVVPHRLDFAPARRPRLPVAAPLVVGVLGNISHQKGAGILKELLEHSERQRRDLRLVVLGTLELPSSSPRLTVTGPYRHEDLVERIEAHGINLFLFPSICPETFSYTVSELMILQLPIVAFDLGAPAERLRTYPHARLVPVVDAAAALTTLVEFHQQRATGAAD